MKTVPEETALSLTGMTQGEWTETTIGWVMTKYLTLTPPVVQPPVATQPTSAPTTSKPTTRPTVAPAPPTTQPPVPTYDQPPASGPEREIFDCVNNARVANGLAPLRWSNQVAGVATNWTRVMTNNNKMSHNPNLADQIPNWRAIGENVGYTTYPNAPQSLCQAWLDSPGHRANIMKPTFARTGIGVVVVNGKTWSTQDFRD